MKIGRAKITLRAEGCTDCGTKWYRRCEVARVVEVVIDGKRLGLEIHRCGDCAAKKAPLLNGAEATQRCTR